MSDPGAEGRRRGPRVLLMAGSPPPEPNLEGEPPALRHEAILALARAVFAAHGTVIVPADDDVALILATTALGYARTPAAEGRSAESPLIVMETMGTDLAARQELWPLVLRGAVSYRDQSGREVDAIERSERQPRSRHSLTTDLIRIAEPSFTVLLSPSAEMTEEAALLGDATVYVFRSTILDPASRPGFEDPTDRLLEDRSANRWSHPDERPNPALPYTFIMQELVSEWTRDR